MALDISLISLRLRNESVWRRWRRGIIRLETCDKVDNAIVAYARRLPFSLQITFYTRIRSVRSVGFRRNPDSFRITRRYIGSLLLRATFCSPLPLAASCVKAHRNPVCILLVDRRRIIGREGAREWRYAEMRTVFRTPLCPV